MAAAGGASVRWGAKGRAQRLPVQSYFSYAFNHSLSHRSIDIFVEFIYIYIHIYRYFVYVLLILCCQLLLPRRQVQPLHMIHLPPWLWPIVCATTCCLNFLLKWQANYNKFLNQPCNRVIIIIYNYNDIQRHTHTHTAAEHDCRHWSDTERNARVKDYL